MAAAGIKSVAEAKVALLDVMETLTPKLVEGGELANLVKTAAESASDPEDQKQKLIASVVPVVNKDLTAVLAKYGAPNVMMGFMILNMQGQQPGGEPIMKGAPHQQARTLASSLGHTTASRPDSGASCV